MTIRQLVRIVEEHQIDGSLVIFASVFSLVARFFGASCDIALLHGAVGYFGFYRYYHGRWF